MRGGDSEGNNEPSRCHQLITRSGAPLHGVGRPAARTGQGRLHGILPALEAG